MRCGGRTEGADVSLWVGGSEVKRVISVGCECWAGNTVLRRCRTVHRIMCEGRTKGTDVEFAAGSEVKGRDLSAYTRSHAPGS